VLALIKGDKEKPVIEFKHSTQMDNPDFTPKALKTAFYDAVSIGPKQITQGIINIVTDEVTSRVKGAKGIAVDSAVDTIKGIIDTFKGDSSLKDIFTIEKGDEAAENRGP